MSVVCTDDIKAFVWGQHHALLGGGIEGGVSPPSCSVRTWSPQVIDPGEPEASLVRVIGGRLGCLGWVIGARAGVWSSVGVLATHQELGVDTSTHGLM